MERVAEGLPFVLEVACGWYTEDFFERQQRNIVGINWSPTLKPLFEELPTLLGKARVDDFDPLAYGFTGRDACCIAVRRAFTGSIATSSAITSSCRKPRRVGDRFLLGTAAQPSKFRHEFAQ